MQKNMLKAEYNSGEIVVEEVFKSVEVELPQSKNSYLKAQFTPNSKIHIFPLYL